MIKVTTHAPNRRRKYRIIIYTHYFETVNSVVGSFHAHSVHRFAPLRHRLHTHLYHSIGETDSHHAEVCQSFIEVFVINLISEKNRLRLLPI